MKYSTVLKYRSTLALLLSSLFISCQGVYAETETAKKGAKASAAYYFDERDYNTLTLVLSTDKIPFGFTLWGFTDFHGDQQVGGQDADFSRSFSEYRLSHSGLGSLLGIQGLGLQAEYNAFTPDGNDLARAGLTYKHALPKIGLGKQSEKNGWLQWRAFPTETDGDGWQASLIYSIPLVSRVDISGFADINFASGGQENWIIEPQLNIHIAESLYAVLEYRYNEFEGMNPNLKGEGWALGARYDF